MKRRKPPGGTVAAAPRRANHYLMPTLLDRLADPAPHRQHEAPGEYAVTRSQMRDIIQRDLAYLLNTSNLHDLIDAKRFPRAAASTINYGVPPLAGAFSASRSWIRVQEIILSAIRNFEPRLIPETLSVTPLADMDALRYNNLPFEVRGEIRMDPYPLEFLVQSTLDLETNQLHVRPKRAG